MCCQQREPNYNEEEMNAAMAIHKREKKRKYALENFWASSEPKKKRTGKKRRSKVASVPELGKEVILWHGPYPKISHV